MDTATLLRLYNAAMNDCVWPDRIAEHDLRFWRRHKMEQPVEARKIMAAHYDRCKGEGSGSLCDSALNEAIRSLT